VIFIESGQLEVISDGKCTRTLQRGDIIGKRWLLKASGEDHESMESLHNSSNSKKFSTQTSLRAHTTTTLVSGLSDVEDVQDLAERFETDFALLRMDRELVNNRRYKKQKALSRKTRAYSQRHLSVVSERDDSSTTGIDNYTSNSVSERNPSVKFEIPTLEEKKTV
jgi:hypothetical protein